MRSSRPRRSRRFLAIRDVLVRHDPEGLIQMGCPHDEYDAEVALILKEVAAANAATSYSVARVVCDIFSRMFEHDFPEAVFDEAASEILAAV